MKFFFPPIPMFQLCLNELKDNSIESLHLNLSRNYIGNQGAECLADALLKNTSLEIFYLEMNPIHEKGEACIREALRKNPNLKEFFGFSLVEFVENRVTLGRWRLEIQKRRKQIHWVLGNLIQERHLIYAILQMESTFPYQQYNTKNRGIVSEL